MIWLVGNRGMLGTQMHRRLQARGLEHVATDLDVDIADRQALKTFADRLDLSWIINCSGYTAVDRAEDEPDQAFRINGDGVRNLAFLAREKGARFLHISTDYVFDGRKEGAYLETDTPNPLGIYGRSKLQGELYIRENIDSHVILRTAWLYGPNGNNFVWTMLRLFQERNEVRVVADQWGSPTLAGDLADVILQIIARDTLQYGTFHFTNEGRTNWFEFATLILELARRYHLLDREVSLVSIRTEQYPTKALRPTNSYLSKEKIKEVFKIPIRPWQEALESFMRSLAVPATSSN
ncbi:MAG: dTDP-4-dehydrorhamnose reductase [Syntrophales bacterium]